MEAGLPITTLYSFALVLARVSGMIAFFPVPGFRAHYSAPLINPHYNPEETVSYDEKGLREALERLPCCTTNADGTVDGDPINLVFVGDRDEIFSAFFDRQWTMAEEVDIGSSWKETGGR